MTVIINFSTEELKTITEALTMGIIHSNDEKFVKKCELIERQISMLAITQVKRDQDNDHLR